MEFITITGLVLRVSLLLAASLGLAFVLKRASASLRRWVLLLGFASGLALPGLSRAVAGREVVRVAAPRLVTRVFAEALSPTVAPRAVLQRQQASRSEESRVSWQTVLVAGWLMGGLCVLLQSCVGVLGARRLARRANRTEQGWRLSADIEGPVVVGMLSPVVLLPLSASAWTEERRAVVLLHENAHVRRRDGLALFAARLVCAVYWFHPLAWLGLARLRRECELAADEEALAAGLRPSSYAEHLLAVARAMSVPVASMAMAARPSELGRRLQVLLSRDALPAPLSRGRAWLLGAAAVGLLSFAACTSASLPTEEQPKASQATTDGTAQRIAVEEAARARSEVGARRVAVVVLAVGNGRVLATTDDRPDAPVVPASTLKPLTVALALDAGLIDEKQRFDCGNGTRAYDDQTLRDAGQYGLLNSSEILAVSSNVGVSRIFDVLGGERLRQGLERFHVDAPADVPSASLRGAIIAMGEGSTTTPLALASAYGVFANDGVYTAPGAHSERVIKVETARSLRAMLEGVVMGERATGQAARVTGVRVGGKTGTSDDPDCKSCAQGPGLFASFVGIVPIDRPRYVIYVGVGQPTAPGTGGSLAAPVFARIAARLLATPG